MKGEPQGSRDGRDHGGLEEHWDVVYTIPMALNHANGVFRRSLLRAEEVLALPLFRPR
jgi:hypothetical protein